jgi:hypothetical protein
MPVTRIEPAELQGKVAVVAQAFDNQWVPIRLLPLLKNGKMTRKELAGKLSRTVHTELKRSLINADRVVVNRAFLHNNPDLVSLYKHDSRERDGFRLLLDHQLLIPFLYDEHEPADEPGYNVSPDDWKAWTSLCSESVNMGCMRMSWDDDLNRDATRKRLSYQLQEFAQMAQSKELVRYVQDLARDYQLGMENRRVVRRMMQLGLRLRAMSEVAQEYHHRIQDEILRHQLRHGHLENYKGSRDPYVSRSHLYKELVTIGPTNEGRIDPSKPDAIWMKQLIDLAYNTVLPDALGIFPLTPQDSLPRTALQEIALSRDADAVTANDIVNMARNAAFSLVQDALYLKSMRFLTLHDVYIARQSEQWHEYIMAVQELIHNPFTFGDPGSGAQRVVSAYEDLGRSLLKVTNARAEKSAQWAKVVQLVIAAGSRRLIIEYLPDGGAIFEFLEASAGFGAGASSGVIAKLVIGGITSIKGQADLENSISFMQGQLAHADQQWKELESKMRSLTNFTEAKVTLQSTDATINGTGQVEQANEQ